MVCSDKQKEKAKRYYWRHRDKILEKAKKHNLSEKSKVARKEYQQSEKGKAAQKRYKCSDKGKTVNKKYRQSDKGKEEMLGRKTRRKRNLGWILMFSNPFDDSVLVDYHHITDVYVVAIPRELHRLYYGKYHREKVMNIVKQIYLGE